MNAHVTPAGVKEMLSTTNEFALIDVREQGVFASGHVLLASNIPLSTLELDIGDLVPRKGTPIVLIDNGDEDLAVRAVKALVTLEYERVDVLDGGMLGWRRAGYEEFSGVNVPSKAFGEFVEHTYDTPRLTAAQIKAKLDLGADMVIVDSRPFDEYQRMNIPGAIDVPGAELVYRIHDIAPNPETLVVVNCAGRTRSIIGAQSLINAGIPNPVVALENGTMGWHMAGFELEHGSTRSAEAPSRIGLDRARASAQHAAERFGVGRVSQQEVESWIAEDDTTTYLFDVRSPAEFAAGHLADYRSAPGGQLVQATDEYVGVRNGRMVLADDIEVRATMTASWLIQLGWKDVHVLAGGIGPGPYPPSADERHIALRGRTLTATELAEALRQSQNVCVVDLGSSKAFRAAHIPGACWTMRSRVLSSLRDLPSDKTIVLTSEDGRIADLASAEVSALQSDVEVRVLAGGTASWIGAGLPTDEGAQRMLCPEDDVWVKPFDTAADREKWMLNYLEWETGLLAQIQRDGSTAFLTYSS